MDDYLREELEAVLPIDQVDALLSRLRARSVIDRELGALNLGPLHYHEALDRVSVVGAYLEEYIGAHPVLVRHPALAAMLARACDALAELYQAIGRMPPLADDP
jgi:hypothetical protein